MRDYTHIGTPDQINAIKSVILDHGAKAVHKAACEHMSGKRATLARMMGIDAPSLGDANRAMTIAFDHMSGAERKADYEEASAYLSKIGKKGGSAKSEAKTKAAKENIKKRWEKSKQGGRPVRRYRNISSDWGDTIVCTFSDYKKQAAAFRRDGENPGQLTRDDSGVYEDGEKIAERVK